MKDRFKLLEDLNGLERNLVAIYGVYQDLPGLIKKEHNCVVEKDLSGLELIVKQKQVVLDHIEEYKKSNDVIAQDLRDLTGCKIKISSIKELLEYLSQVDLDEGLKEKLDSLTSTYLDLSKLISKVSFDIKQNKYLITKLMEEKRQNFLFWQEVISDSLSSYNKKGIQKGTGSASIFKISA